MSRMIALLNIQQAAKKTQVDDALSYDGAVQLGRSLRIIDASSRAARERTDRKGVPAGRWASRWT